MTRHVRKEKYVLVGLNGGPELKIFSNNFKTTNDNSNPKLHPSMALRHSAKKLYPWNVYTYIQCSGQQTPQASLIFVSKLQKNTQN